MLSYRTYSLTRRYSPTGNFTFVARNPGCLAEFQTLDLPHLTPSSLGFRERMVIGLHQSLEYFGTGFKEGLSFGIGNLVHIFPGMLRHLAKHGMELLNVVTGIAVFGLCSAGHLELLLY
jgi:hypothetical protein